MGLTVTAREESSCSLCSSRSPPALPTISSFCPSKPSKPSKLLQNLLIADQQTRMEIDTGADESVLNRDFMNSIQPVSIISTSHIRLAGYAGAARIAVVGTVDHPVKLRYFVLHSCSFFVDNGVPLVSFSMISFSIWPSRFRHLMAHYHTQLFSPLMLAQKS